jgi:glucoamylase
MHGSSHRRRGRAGLACLVAAVALGALAPGALAKPPAPGAPGDRHTWASADKQGFGTSTTRASNVWFTLRSAELTELYWPDLSTPSFRDLQFVVTDGETFVEREEDAGVRARVEALPGSLTFRQTTQTARWRLEKTWVTDPARATVLADVELESLTGHPLQVYVLADPAPGDDGDDDRARSLPSALEAWDDSAASAVVADPELRRTTSGYKGTDSDPLVQLRDGLALDATYDALEAGNVVQAARTRLSGRGQRTRMTLAIGFGEDREEALRTARLSLAEGYRPAATRYASGWSRYLGSLDGFPQSIEGDEHLERLYEQSVMVLEASEDKLNPGASIASPSMPWVWRTLTLERREISGPYHLVWPRDFYHVATAQKAAGDDAAAARLMDYLWRTQKPDGSWWQNMRVNGEPYWTNLQLDEVALPVVLAWWLGRTGAEDWTHVRRAADFIVANGARTGQERWENQDGWSPNTIATAIAGLVCAADVARRNGDEARATHYEAVADEWERRVEDWTATDNGPYSPRPYYVRVTKDANPNNGLRYDLGDNRPTLVDQREIVDNSFLGLVLFGVKEHDDPTVLNSLAVGDAQLRVETPNGPVWHRFTYDGYGETATGADWDIFPTKGGQTLGRLWPLLTGERGEYELVAGRDATSHLETIARTANPSLLLPEQVWDGRPPTGRAPYAFGEPTRSATPLAWTHAQFIRLAWSIDAGAPIETPSIVACRYTGRSCGQGAPAR